MNLTENLVQEVQKVIVGKEDVIKCIDGDLGKGTHSAGRHPRSGKDHSGPGVQQGTGDGI